MGSKTSDKFSTEFKTVFLNRQLLSTRNPVFVVMRKKAFEVLSSSLIEVKPNLRKLCCAVFLSLFLPLSLSLSFSLSLSLSLSPLFFIYKMKDPSIRKMIYSKLEKNKKDRFSDGRKLIWMDLESFGRLTEKRKKSPLGFSLRRINVTQRQRTGETEEWMKRKGRL